MSSARSKSVVRRWRSACHSPRSELRRSGITAPRSARVIASVFVVVTLSTAAIGSGAEPGRWAVLVGVNDYAEAAKLEYSAQDMQALRDQLVASGFAKDHVFLLTDKAREPKYRPSKANIERQLGLMSQSAGPDDFVLVAFSGHGALRDGSVYLGPTEARINEPNETMVSLETVYDKLGRCPAKRKLILLDAALTEPGAARRRSVARPPHDIVVITCCNPEQPAFEDERFGHGVFTHFVLEALRGKADDDKSGSVSLLELYRYVNRETKVHVAQRFIETQIPALDGYIRDDFDIAEVAEQLPP